MNTFVHMTMDQWWEEFKPTKNPNGDESWGGCLYETEEVEQMRGQKLGTIWTLLDVDGRQIIGDGLHFVNRMGFFITEVPAQPETDYEIYDPDDEEEE